MRQVKDKPFRINEQLGYVFYWQSSEYLEKARLTGGKTSFLGLWGCNLDLPTTDSKELTA